jgi:hypothetical protein
VACLALSPFLGAMTVWAGVEPCGVPAGERPIGCSGPGFRIMTATPAVVVLALSVTAAVVLRRTRAGTAAVVGSALLLPVVGAVLAVAGVVLLLTV